MLKTGKNTVRYYLLVAFFFLFLFFSNDFGLTDVQKTAIVTAVGIDREEDTFILTSQIAIPQTSKEGPSAKTVQLVSRGKTIGEAFEEINAKTGWYPKLVFCNLILLGQKTTERNVFDVLDYFLRDDYLSDNCYVATCDGLAKDVLDTPALVDSSSAAAIGKVLSDHAERVGTVMPNNLKDFSIGYFGASKSSYLPIIKKEPQQVRVESSSKEKEGGQNSDKKDKESEKNNEDKQEDGGKKEENQGDSEKDSSNGGSQQGSNGGSNGGSTGETSQKDASKGGMGESNEKSGEQDKDLPVFSAGETALFYGGVQTGRLTTEETFALNVVLGKLRLASYTLSRDGTNCSLVIKHNSPNIKLKAGQEFPLTLRIHLTLNAGVLDYSKSQNLEEIKDVGDVPMEFFSIAEKKLSADITQTFEKCKRANCDVFSVRERLVKYQKRAWEKEQESALQNTILDVNVRFRNVR